MAEEKSWIDWDRAERFISGLRTISASDTPLWAVFVHHAHHSNFFKWTIGKNNHFGFKRTARQSKVIKVVRDGEAHEFSDWDTPEEAMAFYLEVVSRNHPEALKCARCSHCYLWGIRDWNAEGDRAGRSYFRELTRKHRFLQGEDRLVEMFKKHLDYTEI